MLVLETRKSIEDHLNKLRSEGSTIGFVPTMGFLHAGHLSLVDESNKQCDITVASIYVNPSQFNEKKDFTSYPKNTKADLELLEIAGCDVVWVPEVEEVTSIPLTVNYNVQEFDRELEGQHREGHFKGVIEVVFRLFTAIDPDVSFFGEKDYQQFKVIEAMAKSNNFKTKIVPVPTKREADGLAMSSRNVRLDKKERELAPELHAVLKSLSSNKITNVEFAKKRLTEKGFEVEYLTPYEFSVGAKRIFAAVKLGAVRLIDNVTID